MTDHQGLLKLATALGTALLISSCIYSLEDDVMIANAPEEDSSYLAALESVSKNRKVFKDFEKRYEVTATYFAPSFRSALNERSRDIFLRELAPLQQGSGQATFLVSIYSPDEEKIALANQAHWTIHLKQGDTEISPLKVDRVRDKEHLRAFFHNVNDWSHEYLLIFDAPAVNTQSADLVEKTPMNLVFANADAKISLDW